MREAALGYAREKGWAIFPTYGVNPDGSCTCSSGAACTKAGKHPRTENGFKDATTDEAQIRSWWERWPNSNIATPTDGFVVLDADKKTPGALEEFERLEIPADAPMVRTGSGGIHAYLEYPEGCEVKSRDKKLRGLIDVKAKGGYVLVPPSRNANGTYEWERERNGHLPPVPHGLLRELQEPKASVEREKFQVGERIPEGKRDDTMFRLAASFRATGLEEHEIYEALKTVNANRCDPPMTDEEIRAKARSGARYEPGGLPGTKKGQTQAELLLKLAEGCDLFHDPATEDGYATFSTGAHSETHKLRSRGFKQHLRRLYFKREGKPPSNQAVQDSVDLLDARAAFEGEARPVHARLAAHGDAVYLDLCNAEWEVVEITAEGWRVIGHADAPVRFRRAKGMLPLPYPSRNGSFKGLKKLLNMPDEDDAGWILVLAWLVAALRGKGPYPLLVLQGEQGTAKTTIEKILRATIDPSTVPLRAMPRDERDLQIAANNGLVNAYDNISNIPEWLSDALCRLATGGGLSTRELFTDDGEFLFDAKRPCMLNGIANVVVRPDLADRSLIVELPVIEEKDRKLEAELWAAFEAEHPRILGALLDAVSTAIRTLP
ncbi:MAG: bifunctional DNA primase/polymerase, partial [Actinomycetota bacterium]|nr:bifunctional DNA primase/polymerase [Actinomycetota bacterium]